MIFQRTTGLRDLVASHCDGETVVHLPFFGGDDYTTLCALDLVHGDTEAHLTPLSRGARVDCPACIAIWYGAKTIPGSFIDADALAAHKAAQQ